MPDHCDLPTGNHLLVGIEDLTPGQSLPGGLEPVGGGRLLTRVPGVDSGLADTGLGEVPGLHQGTDIAQRSAVERTISEGRAAADIHGPGRADTAGGVEDTGPTRPLTRRPHNDVAGQSVKKRVVDLPRL